MANEKLGASHRRSFLKGIAAGGHRLSNRRCLGPLHSTGSDTAELPASACEWDSVQAWPRHTPCRTAQINQRAYVGTDRGT